MKKSKLTKVLIVSQNFYPEQFKINDIAFYLANATYEVHVLTGIPNYPIGRFYKGYNIIRRRKEKVNNVTIYRCFQVPRGANGSKFFLVLNYLSFMIIGSFWSIFLSLKNNYTVIFVHQVSPVTQSFPAIMASMLRGTPVIQWILDIWPEAFISGSGVRNKTIIKIIEFYMKFTYQRSKILMISSKGFEKSVSKYVTDKSKIVYFPNWAEEIFESRVIEKIPKLPIGFRIILAGNLGVSQNLEILIDLAECLRDTEVKWIIVGSGSKYNWLKNEIFSRKLHDNIFLMGKYDVKYIPSFYMEANALALTLSNEYDDLKLVVPAKLQTYMAIGKPIICFADGAVAQIVKEANCGIVCKGSCVLEISEQIREFMLSGTEHLSILEKNAKEYYLDNFKRAKCLQSLEYWLNNVTLDEKN